MPDNWRLADIPVEIAVIFMPVPALALSDILLAFAQTSSLAHFGRAKIVVRHVREQIGAVKAKRITIDQRLFYYQCVITIENLRSVVEFRDGSLLLIDPAEGDPELVELPEPILHPEELASTSQ